MIETLHHIFSVTSELHGVVDWIISAIMHVIGFLIKTILYPFVYLLYLIVIYAPLQIINALITMFSFFAGGFSNFIFSGQVNKNGSVSYNLDYGSQLGTIIIFVVTLALAIFFVNWLISFASSRQTVDTNGKPLGGMTSKLLGLKYPIFIGLSVLIFPFIFLIADNVMSAILLGMQGGYSAKVSQDDINGLKNNIVPMFSNFQYNIANLTISSQDSGNFLNLLTNYRNTVNNALSQIAGDTSDDHDYSTIVLNLGAIQTDLNTVLNYISSGMQGDASKFQDIVNNKISAGQYISNDVFNSILGIKKNLSAFSYALEDLYSEDLTNLLASQQDPSNHSQWDELASLLQYSNTSDCMLAFSSPLERIADSFKFQDNLYNYFSFDNSGSIIYKLFYGENSQYIGLSTLSNRRQGVSVSTLSLVKTLYTFVTGDKNGDNWNDPTSYDWFVKHATVIQWPLAVFAMFGMILITYTYAANVVRRTFMLFLSWIMGFFYLANGIRDPKRIDKWLLEMFNRWWTIIVLFVLFQLVGAIIPLITKPIQDGLTPYSTFSSANFIVAFAMIFTIEAAYQTAFTIWQDMCSKFDVSPTKSIAPESSMFMTKGKAMAWASVTSAKNVATFSAVREAANDWENTKKFWGGFDDRRWARERNSYTAVQNQIKFEHELKKQYAEQGWNVERKHHWFENEYTYEVTKTKPVPPPYGGPGGISVIGNIAPGTPSNLLDFHNAQTGLDNPSHSPLTGRSNPVRYVGNQAYQPNLEADTNMQEARTAHNITVNQAHEALHAETVARQEARSQQATADRLANPDQNNVQPPQPPQQAQQNNDQNYMNWYNAHIAPQQAQQNNANHVPQPPQLHNQHDDGEPPPP